MQCDWLTSAHVIHLHTFYTHTRLRFIHMFKYRQIPAFFVYFRLFYITFQIQIEKSIDVVLGIQTRMISADRSSDLWRPPTLYTHVIRIHTRYIYTCNSIHTFYTRYIYTCNGHTYILYMF